MDYKRILDTIKTNIINLGNPEFLQNLDKQKINNILIVVGLVVLLDVFFILKPQFNKITKEYLPKKREIIQELKAFKEGVKTSPGVAVKLQQLETNVEESLSQLTSEQDIPGFLSWISSVARDNKVRLMEIKPLKELKIKRKAKDAAGSLKDRYYLLPVQLNLESGYHQLGSFLNQLEQGRYFIRLADLMVKANSKSTITHDINLKLETFILKEQ